MEAVTYSRTARARGQSADVTKKQRIFAGIFELRHCTRVFFEGGVDTRLQARIIAVTCEGRVDCPNLGGSIFKGKTDPDAYENFN